METVSVVLPSYNERENIEEAIERTKDRISNNLLNCFIYPPFKRFLKKRITTRIKN